MTVTRNELTSSRFATCAINRYAIGAVALELFPIRFCYTAAPWALQTNVLEWSIPWVATDWPGQTGFFLLEKIKLQGYSAAFSPFGNSIEIENGGGDLSHSVRKVDVISSWIFATFEGFFSIDNLAKRYQATRIFC